jgi:predicted DNA-binding transcriptional regulator AlpA
MIGMKMTIQNQTSYPRRALNLREAAEYVGVSRTLLESQKGKAIFPPVKISGRNVWYSDLLDRRIDELAIESGALPVGGDA